MRRQYPTEKMREMKITGVSNAQKFLVSEYSMMKCEHSCMTCAISTNTSFEEFIFDRDLFSRISSKACWIPVTRSPIDASKLVCDRISYSLSCQSKALSMMNKYLRNPVQRTERHLSVWMDLWVSSAKTWISSIKD